MLWNTGPTSRGIVARHAVESAGVGDIDRLYDERLGREHTLNYFRDYDPQTGRYVESDPIGLYGGSRSTYSYTNGNPISGSDSLGIQTAPAVPVGPGPGPVSMDGFPS
jgi:RHS repeat-associated protein